MGFWKHLPEWGGGWLDRGFGIFGLILDARKWRERARCGGCLGREGGKDGDVDGRRARDGGARGHSFGGGGGDGALKIARRERLGIGTVLVTSASQ